MILPPSKNSKGFTLIEIILAIFITTIIGVAITAFSRGVMRNSSLLGASLSSQAQIRKTFKSFTAEVRSAAPSWDGSYVVDVASSTEFSFYVNIDEDKYTEKVRYYALGNNLNKGIYKYNTVSGHYDLPESTKIIVNNINVSTSTPLFSYYDKSYDGTDAYPAIPFPVDISKVRLVKFDLSNNQYGKYIKDKDSFTVQVSLRNLKD